MLLKNTFQKKLSFEVFGKTLSIGSGEIIRIDERAGRILLESPWIERLKENEPKIEKKAEAPTIKRSRKRSKTLLRLD